MSAAANRAPYALPDTGARARSGRPPERAARGASAALEGVSLVFDGGATVLDDITLRVAPGEAVCLVGPSGGGKSTILNLVAGLLKPTAGKVFFDNRLVEGPGPERAVVFQDAALFPWLTLADNVGFPLETAGVPKKERLERVAELLRLVHLWRFRDSFPHQLSGGMRQRGAIARALATKPQMLLFDEPFAELAHLTVERIVRASRTTMIFVTHQIEEAVRLGDRVVLVGTRPGRIIGDVAVDLPRPRAGDMRAARLVQQIADEIRAEVEKVAREEADDAWGSQSGADRGDPRRRMGSGI